MAERLIAASVGGGSTTVHEYLARAEAAGVGWPLPEGMDDEALEVLLFPPPTAGLLARQVTSRRELFDDLEPGAAPAARESLQAGPVEEGDREHRLPCVIRPKADTDSGGNRTPVPDESGHAFRLIPDT